MLGLPVRRGLTPPDPGAAVAPLRRRSALPNPPGAFSRTRERAAPLNTQGRVVVRHSPCTPWRLPTGSGHRSALPQDPLLPEDAAPRAPPNLPPFSERPFRTSSRTHPCSSPDGDERAAPLDALPQLRRQDGQTGSRPAPSVVRAPFDAHDIEPSIVKRRPPKLWEDARSCGTSLRMVE